MRAVCSANPIALLFCILLRDGNLVARHHFHLDTHLFGLRAMVALESSRGGSYRGSTPRNRHWPWSSVRATASERKPREANSLTAFSTSAFLPSLRLAASATSDDFLRRALRDLERLAAGSFDTSASVCLWSGSNGWKLIERGSSWTVLRPILDARQHGEGDGILVFGARCKSSTQ